MRLKKLLAVLVIATVAFAFTGIGCKVGEDKGGEKKEVTILYPNWAEGIALTHLAKVAMEDKGYDVTIKPIEPGPIYAALAKGDADLFLDAWLPHTHKSYWEKYGNKIDKLGESFSGGTTGLVVPAYVEEESITDLKAAKDKYDGKIIGIGSGAGIHKNTEKAIEAYDLPFKQITSSGPAMIAALEKAYNKKEPIVITGWKPHFKWAKYDLKYLKDPKDVYPKDVMAILARKGFDEEYPEVTAFMGGFNFKEKNLYDLMDTVKKADDPLDGAKKWYEENKDMIQAMW
jgi:glycine betaine/proline transport system substrate-binding protein